MWSGGVPCPSRIGHGLEPGAASLSWVPLGAVGGWIARRGSARSAWVFALSWSPLLGWGSGWFGGRTGSSLASSSPEFASRLFWRPRRRQLWSLARLSLLFRVLLVLARPRGLTHTRRVDALLTVLQEMTQTFLWALHLASSWVAVLFSRSPAACARRGSLASTLHRVLTSSLSCSAGRGAAARSTGGSLVPPARDATVSICEDLEMAAQI